MRRKLAAVGLTAGLAGGAVAGFAFTANSGIVGAQDGTTTTTVANGQTPPDGAQRPDPSARLQEALQGLIDDGTITQDQADKVIEALIAAGPGRGEHGPGGKGGRGGPGLDAAATALGLTADELKAELDAGSTIAQVAESKGVDLQTVVDAVVADVQAHIAQEVADGKITQDEADERLANLEERVTARLNGEQPAGGPGRGGPGGGGFGGGGFGGPGGHRHGDGPPPDGTAPDGTAPDGTAPDTSAPSGN